jgi:AcrR family transcriptional regulator
MPFAAQEATLDRRVRRTRSAIVEAFNRLILERGYAGLTPGDVSVAANVGRSTFYEHFRGVDDVLAQTLGALLAPLAKGCFEAQPPAAARQILEHIWENRRLGHILFNGEAQGLVLQSFAAQFEEALLSVPRREGAKPILSPPLIALHLAAGQLALMRAWISGRYGHSAQEISEAMYASGRGSAFALMGRAQASDPDA